MRFITILILFFHSTLAFSFDTNKCFNINSPPKNYKNNFIKDLDFSTILKNSRVIIIGENHADKKIKSAILSQLSDIKNEGVTDLALEFVSSSSDLNEMNEQEVRDHLLSSKNWDIEPYVKLIMRAKNLGIKIHGYNAPLKSRSSPPLAYKDLDSKKEREQVSQEVLKQKRMNIYDASNFHDLYMAFRIKIIMNLRETKKVLVLTGASHAGGFYDTDEKDNSFIQGQLLRMGLAQYKITNIVYKKLPFYKFKSKYLPLPKGELPGCGQMQVRSMYDGIIYY